MDIIEDLATARARSAKWAFTTRRVDRSLVAGMSRDLAAAVPGDLLLAEVAEVGQHGKLQLAEGRSSESYPGDLVVVCVGERYAPDQFEGVAEIAPEGCDLMAGGGIAGRVVRAHERMEEPTRLRPVGLLRDADGETLNVASFALPERAVPEDVTVIGVFGTSMNAGKTTAAVSLAHGLRRAGVAVAGIKATGTGAFGDYNAFLDAGVPARDFTDAGMPSTYRMPLDRIEAGFRALVGHAAAEGAEVVVVEFADGVLQEENAALLEGSATTSRLDGVLFAAGEAAGALGGVSRLRQRGLAPLAVSGLVTCSPLAVREGEWALEIPFPSRDALRDPAVALRLMGPVMRTSRAPRAVPAAAAWAAA